MMIISLGIYIVSSITFFTVKYGISPMPTSAEVRKRVFQLIEEKHTKKPIRTIVDLGSGWGSLAIPLAKAMPHVTIYAYETSHIPYLYCKLRLYFSPQENLILQKVDFFSVPLQSYDIILCYLYPKAMKKLRSKFEQELNASHIVISHTFSVPTWKANEVWQINDLFRTKIYLYERRLP
ncbi:hypothetical protein BHU72_06920 [Desulfuribacillus stibiiarsenatis]|uniref:Methyltransferase small domain-containing protein n=2 Tax=Desulfuribacillus stibiiarsenatis TaxID=1390249 RepID=A0A1E5L4K6_9FIRM|nr:hypothetical protein BHU72_06920 [Desulfuribacillus stibiiarsenatis]